MWQKKIMHNKKFDSFADHFAEYFTQNQSHKNVVRVCLSKQNMW